MALLGAAVNAGDFLSILIRFPGILASQRLLVQVVWASGPGSHKILGAKFVQVPETLAGLLKKFTGDFQECEKRIEAHDPEVCRRDCAYWWVCLKTVKLEEGHQRDLPNDAEGDVGADI